jgi:hypothetical protein
MFNFFRRAIPLFLCEVDEFVPVLRRSFTLDAIGNVDLLVDFFAFVLPSGTFFWVVLESSVGRVAMVVALAVFDEPRRFSSGFIL